MTEARPETIFKLGGSLLDLDDLAPRLAARLARAKASRPAILCGGGAAADLVRTWDRRFALSAERGHWLAVHAMGLSARLLCDVVPRCRLALARTPLDDFWRAGDVPVLDAFSFLTEIDAASVHPLPRTWQATSDSIAARMAETLGAEQLVLLKSVSVRPRTTRAAAARDGVVDAFFPEAARALERVSVDNLRDPGGEPTPLL